MRIGIVLYPTYGGSGVLATELGKALADKGHQVHFISYKQPARLNNFHTNIYYHEVNVPSYPLFEYPPYESALSSTMVDVAINQKLDLLHVHYAIPHASAAYLAKRILKKKGINLPVITTLHGTDITLVGKDKTYAPVVSFSIEESDAVTAVSNALREETYSYFDVEKEIRVIYNFVDTNRFHPRSKKHNCQATIAPYGEKIILHVSNFRPVKRTADVVKVFKRIHDEVPSKLVMIGDGPDRPFVEGLCREYRICNDILFMGKQANLEDIMGCSDLFLLPSETESFGLAGLEAMASKTPLISTNGGGLPEINIQGETGFLSAVGDVEDMAHNSINLLTDEKLYKRVSRQAYEHAQDFEIGKIIPQYEALYRSVTQEVLS